MKTTVIYHSADFDGIFCREIARKFLPPDTEFIGWDFGDDALAFPSGKTYILDLPVDRVFGFDFNGFLPAAFASKGSFESVVWIDHHASSIASHPTEIPGYRIDGVAACRLTFQWFLKQWRMSTGMVWLLPDKTQFIDRKVTEPEAVRLAGEYDIWDKRDPNAELFQHGLRSQELSAMVWERLLNLNRRGTFGTVSGDMVEYLLKGGAAIQYAKTQENESIIKAAGFTIEFEGLKFLAVNHARYNSHLFTAALRPEHDACFGFKFTGHCAAGESCEDWSISLYHAPGKEHHDLSKIAVKHGGGGHRGACGFRTKKLPFLK